MAANTLVMIQRWGVLLPPQCLIQEHKDGKGTVTDSPLQDTGFATLARTLGDGANSLLRWLLKHGSSDGLH